MCSFCRTSTVELASTRHTRTMNTREICSCRCLGASSYLAGIFLHCGASCRPGYVTMTIVQTTHLRTPENPVMPRMPCMSIEHLSRCVSFALWYAFQEGVKIDVVAMLVIRVWHEPTIFWRGSFVLLVHCLVECMIPPWVEG